MTRSRPPGYRWSFSGSKAPATGRTSQALQTRPTTWGLWCTGSTSICVALKPRYDVVVVGGGNAAVCAALEARRLGASVLILEAAPQHMRGGNSRHTRNVRYMHIGPDNYLVGDYTEDEFFADLVQVTGGETNEGLARMTIRASQDLGQWISGNGVRWQGALKGTLSLNRTNAFFLGGGKALLNHY